MESFKVGQVVELISGGPPMTVISTDTAGNSADLIQCIWVDDDEKEEVAFFATSALRPVEID